MFVGISTWPACLAINPLQLFSVMSHNLHQNKLDRLNYCKMAAAHENSWNRWSACGSVTELNVTVGWTRIHLLFQFRKWSMKFRGNLLAWLKILSFSILSVLSQTHFHMSGSIKIVLILSFLVLWVYCTHTLWVISENRVPILDFYSSKLQQCMKDLTFYHCSSWTDTSNIVCYAF